MSRSSLLMGRLVLVPNHPKILNSRNKSLWHFVAGNRFSFHISSTLFTCTASSSWGAHVSQHVLNQPETYATSAHDVGGQLHCFGSFPTKTPVPSVEMNILLGLQHSLSFMRSSTRVRGNGRSRRETCYTRSKHAITTAVNQGMHLKLPNKAAKTPFIPTHVFTWLRLHVSMQSLFPLNMTLVSTITSVWHLCIQSCSLHSWG